MLYDAKENAVRPQRAQEESHDYRCFPEPDLPPLVLPPAWVPEQQARLPELPAAKRERFVAQYALSVQDAAVLTASRAVAEYYESTVHSGAEPKPAANWVMGEVLADAKDHQEQLRVPPGTLAQLVALVQGGTLSHQAAKRVSSALPIRGPPGLLSPPFLQRLAPHPLRKHQCLLPRGVETPSRGVPLAEQLHHVLECHSHVALHVRVGQVPAAVLGDHLKHPLPALALSEMHHPTEQAAAGAHAEQRRRQDGVQVGVAAAVVLLDHFLGGASRRIAQVRLEATLPIPMPQRGGGRRPHELARDEQNVGHG